MSDDGHVMNETMVRFERILPGPIERVWDFLTQSDHLAGWFGAGPQKYEIEPRAGGAVNLMNGHIRGVVTQWRPPHLLAYTWNVFMEGETESRYPESYVTFELKTQGDQVALTLSHRPMLPGFETQSMMGWHTFLDLLEALLRGNVPETREAVMARNRIRYGVTEIRR